MLGLVYPAVETAGGSVPFSHTGLQPRGPRMFGTYCRVAGVCVDSLSSCRRYVVRVCTVVSLGVPVPVLISSSGRWLGKWEVGRGPPWGPPPPPPTGKCMQHRTDCLLDMYRREGDGK